MSRLNNTNGALLSALNNNTPFIYAHLVKFERPTVEANTNIPIVKGTNGNKFAYITDAGYDITWDDGSTYLNSSDAVVANGNRTYTANKLLKTGSVTESTRVKVDGLNIEVDATAIDTEVTSTFTVTSTEIQGLKGVDLAAAGFKVGDKIRFTDNASSELTITGFKGDGQGGIPGNLNARMTYTVLSGSQSAFSSTEKTLTLVSEEVKFLTNSTLDTSFVNRQVIVYKAFFYADNPHTLIGDPIKLFEGIITGGSYKQSEKKASVSWQLKSHWGDFEQTRGRITSADFHQALDQNENPQKDSTLKKAYAEDYGFAHSEMALNVIAQYQDIEMQLKEKKKKKWYGATKYKYKEIEVEVTRETDLRFDLQARRIPLIYGVVRTKPVPVFADIGASSDTNNQVFTAHVLSEGPIQSIMNIYVDDMPLVCIDEADATARSTGSDAVDIKCVGRTDSGEVLGGAAASTASELTYDVTEDFASVGSENPAAGGLFTRAISKARAAVLAYAFANPSTSSFQSSSKGIFHERNIKFTDPEDWYLEFHGGYEDQAASSMISTQANTSGKKFRIQEDYWTPAAGSGIEYWGPQHQLLDTAYAAIKFELSPDQTQLPSLEYVVKGKMIECYNYDGSYEHNSLVTYNSEDITNFTEGDTVTIKTRRGFTASSDAGGATYSANDTIAASKTILELFYFVDGKGETHWRMRWDLTGQQQDILNEAKDFYVVKGSDTWSMITYDGTATIDTNITIAEVLTTTISSPTSSGNANYAATRSNQSSSFDASINNEAMFRFLEIHESEGAGYSDRYYYSQALNGSLGNNTLTFSTINSQKAATMTKVDITNKLKLSSNASSTDDFYNGMNIVVTKVTSNGDREKVVKKIEDYDGSTRVATLTQEFLEFRPSVGDKVEIKFTKDVVSSAAGNDVRPSTNFAMILLDYISSKTYGPGIDLDTKIDLDTFRLAAQMCDTQSDVTVKFASSVSLTEGDVYRYFENSLEKWRGTVKSTASGTSHVFTNCFGKLTNKFNNWKYRNLGDLVYTSNGTDLYKVTTGGTQSSISTNASTEGAPVLRKVSGSGPSTATMVGNGTGNPVTAYSLYDADDVKFWKYLGWEEPRQKYATRHQGNIKLDTNQTVFQIIQGLLEHFNGQLAFVDGKYRLTVESTRTADELDSVFTDNIGGNSPTVANLDIRARYITAEDIIGNISIKDAGLSKAFNSLSASIADPQLNFDSRSVSFFNSEYLKADRGVVRSTNFTAGGITNYFNARMLVKQTLDKSRFNRQISFTMRPVGISILPGELIRIEYDRFGWNSTAPKLFRVETVSLKEDCLIGITAEEYDDSVYLIDPPKTSAFFIDTKQAAVARVPTAPSNVTVSSSGPAGANVVSWTASAGLGPGGKYEVWRATNKSGNPSTSVVSHATQLDFEPVTNTYTDIGFTNTSNVTYYYWVRAYNEMVQQTTSGTDQRRKKYYSAFNANSNYGDATDAAQVGRAVADGISPISVDIKSSAVLVQCDSAGAVILSGGQIPDSGNEFRVFEGTTQLQFDGAGTSNGTFNITVSATNVNNGTIVDSGAHATVNPATGMTADIGTLVFTISGKTSTGTAFTATRTQGFTKAIPGETGVGVELAPSKYVINYTKANSESDTITLTATPRNMSNLTPHYQFTVGGSNIVQSYSTTATHTLADNLEPASGASTLISVSVKDGGTGDVLAADSVSIYGVKDGEDAQIGFLTNTSEAIPSENDGTLQSGALNNAGGTFKVFVGGTERTTHSDVTFAASNATGMASAINSNTGVYTVSALNSDQASVQFTATIAAGSSLLGGTGASAVTIGPLTYSMAKAKKGAQGNSITGATGPRTTTARLFYSVAAASAPTAPTSSNTNTFVFNTAVFSNRASNWQHNPPTFAGSNQNKYWYIPFTVTEASFGGTQSITFGSVTQAIGFTGLVTFSNGDTFGDGTNAMSFGASGTTSINGGNITTGVVNLGTSNGMAIRQGKTGYPDASTTGFWLGNDGGTPKFSIGTSTNFLRFSGSALELAGTLKLVDGGSTTTLSNSNTLNGNTEWSDVAGTSNAPADNATANRTDSSTDAAIATAESDAVATAGTNANTAAKTGGSIGGWELGTSRIYSNGHGTTSLSAGSGFLGSTGMVLRKEGAIHSKNFYINENGNAGFTGAITATSLSFGTNVTVDYDKISGTNKPANGATANQSDATTNNAISAKSKVFRQTNTPTALAAGDVWIDTNDGNKMYVASAAGTGSWNLSQDAASKTTAAAAAAAANSADKDDGSVGGWNLDANNIFSGTSADASGYTSSGMTLNKNGSIHAPKFYIDTSGNAFFKGSIESSASINGTAASTITADAALAKWSISGTSTNYRAPIYTQGSGTTTPNSGEQITVTATNGSTTHTYTVTFTVTTSTGAVATGFSGDTGQFSHNNTFGTFTASASTPVRVGTVTHTTSGLKWKISYGSMNVEAVTIQCCFIGDTLIDMIDGARKAIKDIEIGDRVIVETGTAEVIELHPTILGSRKLYSINGGTAFVTSEHPFKTEEGWKSIDPEKTKEEREELYKELKGTLQIGDKVLKSDGQYHEITDISSVSGDYNTPLYNFTVGLDDHSYFADGYCVHNK